MMCALDTNLLAYAEGVNGRAMQDRAWALLEGLRGHARIPGQVILELYNVLTRKAGRSAEAALDAAMQWPAHFPLVDQSDGVTLAALELACRHRLSVWDALVIAAAQSGGCGILLSEDLQAGFRWHGITVINPFTAPKHPLLDALLH